MGIAPPLHETYVRASYSVEDQGRCCRAIYLRLEARLLARYGDGGVTGCSTPVMPPEMKQHLRRIVCCARCLFPCYVCCDCCCKPPRPRRMIQVIERPRAESATIATPSIGSSSSSSLAPPPHMEMALE